MGNCWSSCMAPWIYSIFGNSWPVMGSPSCSMPAIESIRGMYHKIDPPEQIDPLIRFIENEIHKMKNPSEAGPSSSEGWLETVKGGIEVAANTVDTIYTEAQKLSQSEDAVEAMGSLMLTVMEGMGELQLVFLGLSLTAFAVQSYTDNECRELLLRIVELVKAVNECWEYMPDRREERVRNAVGTIVQGALIFHDYKRGNVFRFWSGTAVAAQLEKTNQQIRYVTDSRALSSLQRHWDKDVFLSHSGKQKNFMRQLYQDFTRQHVSCFFDEDYDSLPLGEKFPRLIFKAAETCKTAVVLLSKEFILSKWPMLELSAFNKAKKTGNNAKLQIIPIFFKIRPDEVFQIIKDNPEWKKMEESDVRKSEWHDALKEVRSMNGLQLFESGNEVDCRDKVVKAICRFLREINPRNPPKLLDFEPVGIEKQVDEVKALLDMEGAQSALAVIVCGFGGVGKSTASAVQSLDWSSTEFKFCRVAIDETTQDKTSHIIQLQKYIIDRIGGDKIGGDKSDFQNLEDGRHNIQAAVQNKCSLLFIDNVVNKDYVRDLLPRYWNIQEKTKLRILITCRQKNVKAELGIMGKDSKEYDVNPLSDGDSERLLLQTIVEGEEVEDKEFEERLLIKNVAAACKGVPLLLSVFGKHLRVERNKNNYEEALNVLREGSLDSYRDEDLGTKLMFVYDKMPVEVQEAFLDICAYFVGWEWNVVADIVDEDIKILEDLRRRMLVSKDESGAVIVHDILCLMGMKKARFTRFSNYKELSDALEDKLKPVKGISLVNSNSLITIQSTQLEDMHHSLRVLMLGDWVTMDGPPCHKAFTNLRYLSVGDITVFPFEDPSKLKKLKVFVNRSKPGMNLSQLPSGVKRISHQVPYVECEEFGKLPFENLSVLKSFIVNRETRKVWKFYKDIDSRKSVALPEELYLPPSLVDLNLSRCKNIPKDMGHLTALESLILDRSDMKCLPQGFGKLQKLKHLSMCLCSRLTFLSEELGVLSSLKELSVERCENLRALPARMEGLLALQTLKLRGCINLHVLPESFGELRLRSLKLDSLVNLKELPNSFGNMPLLEDLTLESCESLMSLPSSFGRLRHLKKMTVEKCNRFKELPRGFGALPALKAFNLSSCCSFVNLPRDFTELTSLEKLHLYRLPSISRIPDGLGKLKNLRVLNVSECDQLKILSDDFENLATLEQLTITYCPQLDGALMEKILKLQHCFMADINGSSELIKKWKDMQSQTEHLIAVLDGGHRDGSRNAAKERAIRVGLLQGKCMELNNTTQQLMERSSLLAVLEEGTSVTVALIMLPLHVQSHHQQTLQRFVEMARKTATTNGSHKLQIVCCSTTAQKPTPTEKEEAEELGQILLLLPEGSCVIPSSEFKRVKLLSWCFGLNDYYNKDKLILFMANEVLHIDGRKSFENLKFTRQDETSANAANVVEEPPPPPPLRPEMKKENIKHHNTILDFRRREDEQCQSPAVVGQSKTREFMEALKGNGIHYLLTDNNTTKVMVDDLHSKIIGFSICDFELMEHIKLLQIYKDLQQKYSNFIAIWIPTQWPKDYGHGTFTRLIQCIPGAKIPRDTYTNLIQWMPLKFYCKSPSFVLLDEQGQIANHDALPSLLAWGVKSYPFTQHTITESFSVMESESCLEFLLQGMNIVGRKPMKKKMTFLYAECARQCSMLESMVAKYMPETTLTFEYKVEQLLQVNGDFDVLYVGRLDKSQLSDTGGYKQHYENKLPEYDDRRWASLSFPDMITFWYRCEYLASDQSYALNKESNMLMEPLHRLAKELCSNDISLVLVDKDGIVTRGGADVVQMICDSPDGEEMRMVKDELAKSWSRGECSPIVKTFFRDEIHDHPQHPHHCISYSTEMTSYTCHVCSSHLIWYHGGPYRRTPGWATGLIEKDTDVDEERRYRCEECNWDMCRSCWMVYAKHQLQQHKAN